MRPLCFYMQLRSKLTDEEAIIYREKWGTLAFAAALGFACVAFAIGFYWLSSDHAGPSKPFLIVFCSIFGIAGLALLIRLPIQARQVIADNGVRIVVANRTGITLRPNFGAEEKHYTWSTVAEVVLAEKLKIVGSDETTFLWRSIVVFLSRETHKSTTWLDRLTSGMSISGKGHRYLLGSYPRSQGQAIESAIRQFAPGSVPVRFVSKAVFDTKVSTDTYPGA